MNKDENVNDIQALVEDSTLSPINANEAAITRAISNVMGGITRVPKNAKNAFHGYNYASADDVFETVRPLLAKNGLEICMSELNREFVDFNDKKIWMLITYELGFVGGTTETRSVIIHLKDSQSMQAAATYAIKYWLRTKLLLSTGEPDTDAEGETLSKKATVKKAVARQKKVWSLGKDLVLVRDMKDRPQGMSDTEPTKSWETNSKREVYKKTERLLREHKDGLQIWDVNKQMLHGMLPESGFIALNNVAKEVEVAVEAMNETNQWPAENNENALPENQ